MQAEQRRIAPHRVTFYKGYINGETINPVKLNVMWKEYMNQVYADQLLEACRATGCIAVAANILSRFERDQHKERRYKSGNHMYYLFPRNAVPLPIYCKLTPEDGRLIYNKGNG